MGRARRRPSRSISALGLSILERERREIRAAVEEVLLLGAFEKPHDPVGYRRHDDLRTALEHVLRERHGFELRGIPQTVKGQRVKQQSEEHTSELQSLR